MAEFLDGVDQSGASSGGLTSVIDKTLAGGAATEFGDTIALVDGGVYEFTSVVEQNGSGTPSFGFLFDSDSTGTNYLQIDRIKSNVSSGGVQGFQSDATFFAASVGAGNAAGAIVIASLGVTVSGTILECEWWATFLSTLVGTAGRSQFGRFRYDGGTLPTQIGVLSSLASGIANGSTIKGVRLY